MLYVFSIYDIGLLVFGLFFYITITDIINRHYYTRHIKKLEKAVKELKKYGYTDTDID